MIRKSLLLLMLLAIIACPFNCLGVLKALVSSSNNSIPTCSCCAPSLSCDSSCETDPSSSSDEELPIRPYNKNGCPSCVCNGAFFVTEVQVVSNASEIDDSLNFAAVEVDWQKVQPTIHVINQWLASISLSASSGSFVRISNQSFLI